MSEQPVVLNVHPDGDTPSIGEGSYAVATAASRESALDSLATEHVDLVVCHHAPEAGLDGLDVLEAIRADHPTRPVVLATDEPDGSVAASATRLGVTEYVPRSEVHLGGRVRELVSEAAPSVPPAPSDITAETPSGRTRREAELTAMNQRLNLALEGSDTGVYEWDLGTGDVVWDEVTADLFGVDPGTFDGSVEAFHEFVHPDDRSQLEAALTAAREHDEQFQTEFRAVVDGTTRWIYTNGVIEERDADAPRLVAIATDVTDEKTRELELRRNIDALEQLTELATTDSLSEAEIIDRVLELGAERLDLSLGYLSRIEGRNYEVVSVVGDHDVIESGATADLEETYCRRLVGGPDSYGVHDAAEEMPDHPSYELSGLACYLGGKVVVDGELYGTLCFADEEPRSEPFSEAEQTYTRLLAGWVSRELERRRRKTELEQYENVIEAVDDGVYALDETGNFELVNDAMEDLTGYDTRELLGKHTSYIKNDEVVERAESIVREMIFDEREDDEETFELSIQRADGAEFPAEDHMTLLWDDDGERFEGTAGIVRDITERKERERELRAARERIEQILQRIGDAFFAVDDDWTLTYWNDRAEEVLGRPAEEVMGEDLWEMFPDAADSMFYESYHEAMETQEPVIFEEYYPPIEKWFRVTAYPDTDGLSVYFHDITDEKERDQRLSGLLDVTRSLMQAQRPEEVARTVVEAAETELGFDLNLVRLYDEETGTLRPVAGTEGVPERPVYDADEAFPGEAFQRGETVRVDDFDRVEQYDSERPTGAMYVPVGDHGVLSVATRGPENFDDADVSVAEILASNAAAALDRVEREQDLLRYETVIENVRDMVYVLDEEGRFQLVTEPLADWLGYERAELRGRHPELVLDSQSVEAFAEQIRQLREVDSEASIQMETSLRRADGSERPAEIEVSLLDDELFRGTAGVVRDLTELKRTREELRDERDRFSYLFNNLPDAVVETEVIDEQALVRSVNPAFTDVFGLDHAAVLDSQLDETLAPPGDGSSEADRLVDHGEEGDTVQLELRRRTANGFRDFLFRGIPYRRDDGRLWSFGIYTDITEQKERQRRLQVLNRVLRHNLRNDLTVVLGLADELDERIDDEGKGSLLDRLQQKAEQIASLSDRAREIERSVRRDDADSSPIDVSEAVQSLTETYTQQYDVTIETRFPETNVRGADGRFRRVVGELLENSVEHAGEDPTISVTVEASADTVSVTVADDGPGIPEHELAVVTGEEPITQLSHGSGLGLWLVIWVVESYGGTVTFGEDGTAVTLSVPRL